MAFTLKRPLISRLTLLILAAVYIAVFLNVAYYRQVLAVMPLNDLHTTLVFLSMPLVAFSVINIVITLASLSGWIGCWPRCLFCSPPRHSSLFTPITSWSIAR